jgi:hypothetical protein
MVLNTLILAAVVISAAVLWSKPVHGSTTWRAMTTPLASIIGSGFLVLGPLLDTSYGMYAPLVMAGLCLGAYMLGEAIRYNIASHGERAGRAGQIADRLDTGSSWVLGFAYVVSVAYYLNLLGAFGLSLTDVNSPADARLLTTAVFALILFAGWTRGFKSLETMEYLSVTVKLAIIMGLLAGMAIYFKDRVEEDALQFNTAMVTGWPAVTLAFGMVVTVQGFETSRYLGKTYDVATRIRSMKWAQWTASIIYLVYIVLLSYVFEPGQLELSETAIVDMMRVVAPVLPVLLVAAALAAQFSAAVADTSGAGGLFQELSQGRISERMAYAGLCLLGVALTWIANIFEIIAYASQAFALYYAMQCAIAAIMARARGDRVRTGVFFLFGALALAAAMLGRAAETGAG